MLLSPGVERGLSAPLALPGATRRRTWIAPLSTLTLFLLSLVLSRPFAERLSRFDNFRFLLSEKAPILGRAVELSARLAPPPPLEPGEPPCAGPGCAEIRPGQGPARSICAAATCCWSASTLCAPTTSSSYGYSRATTPNLDRLAKEGVVFERAYTATPHTSYAVTSLMTGKYMRPLLLQGSAADSDTWAGLMRTYGYRTAAFYPPAVFFIDPARFTSFSGSQLGFEYAKVEFAEGEQRVAQVRDYLARAGDERPLFAWVHLFGPHEPYERHPEYDFGSRDIDRYDSEIAAADPTLGALVELVRRRKPNARGDRHAPTTAKSSRNTAAATTAPRSTKSR